LTPHPYLIRLMSGKNPFRILHTLRALWRTGAESGKVGRESHSGRKGTRDQRRSFSWVFGPCPLTSYERQ
jgi:hypothetical protein